MRLLLVLVLVLAVSDAIGVWDWFKNLVGINPSIEDYTTMAPQTGNDTVLPTVAPTRTAARSDILDILASKEVGEYAMRPVEWLRAGNASAEFELPKLLHKDEDDFYYCYVCADDRGAMHPQQIAHQVQSYRRHPAPPACNRGSIAYHVLCQGLCVSARYTYNDKFVGYLRDCATAADFVAYKPEDYKRYPAPEPRETKLSRRVKVEIKMCRGDYCNIDINDHPRVARIPISRVGVPPPQAPTTESTSTVAAEGSQANSTAQTEEN